ncbi:MAG TPA: hypothetical protein VMC07_03255 [Candidatus Omnitrophota bacterium]|nr:hypothetical protein [Candidatus Omnitrophota bacterium]
MRIKKMSYDGSHLVCEKCLGDKHYSTVEKRWICARCELEESEEK